MKGDVKYGYTLRLVLTFVETKLELSVGWEMGRVEGKQGTKKMRSSL